MGKDWNNAVGAKRREGGRLQQHSRPDSFGAEIINKTEGRLAEHFGSEVDLDLRIVMDSQLGTSAFQSIEDSTNRKILTAAHNIEMKGGKLFRNFGIKFFEQLKRTRNQGGAAANHPTFRRGVPEIGQLRFAKIRHDRNEINFLFLIVSMNRLLDRSVADDAGAGSIDHVAGNADLKGSEPEGALPRRAGRVELMESRYPSAPQVWSELFDEATQPKWDAARLIAVVHVV